MERPPIGTNSTVPEKALLGMDPGAPASAGLRAAHRVDLRGAFGQRARAPALAAVLAGEHLAPVRAAEQTGATDREDLAGAPAPDEDAVHVHGVVVHVLSVAHVVPVLAAVEAADHAADFDRAIDLVGVGRTGGELQDTLGRI